MFRPTKKCFQKPLNRLNDCLIANTNSDNVDLMYTQVLSDIITHHSFDA